MTAQRQVCPLCGAENPWEEKTCAICGAALRGQTKAIPAPASKDAKIAPPPRPFYDFSLGEDDLMASTTMSGLWVALSLILFGLATALGVFFLLSRSGGDQPGGEVVASGPSLTPNATLSLIALSPQPTLSPTLSRTPPPPLPSVTLTMTPTFTPGPCEFAVAAGDSLYALALRCGHQSYDVIDDIIALNELPNEAALQIGQVIRVPLPTATLDINAANTLSAGVAANAAANDLDGDGQVSAEELIASRQQAAEPTLDPNLQWYVVQAGETLYEVIAKNNINVKLLSEINPEVDFPQCDFGETFGGPRCAVFLSEGQRLRVPAPTPTPTIPPTASGSETPTPTATATINIPTALQPDNGAVFDAASIVTLRWSTTGTLGRDEVYLIRARNLSTGEIFTGITCDLSFDLPREWQAKTEQYIEFEWQMSITNVSPFGTGQDNYMTRFSGYALCDMSFEPPISWLPAAANTVDYGRIVDLRLGDERFPTPLRRFQWQGRP